MRLYSDYREAEAAYFRKTGVFPIMHLIAIRRDVVEAYPWVAMNLFKAFEEAKRRSLARLSDITASHAPLAWLGDYVAEMRALFGDDPFPYGIELNRRTLEAFLQFGFEQGVCHPQVTVDELFPSQLQASFKV